MFFSATWRGRRGELKRWRRARQQMAAPDAVKAAAAVGWRRPAAVESAAASLYGRCGSGTACNEEGHEAGAAEELGDECPVRFAEKTSQNIVPADLLREENTVLAEKTS